MVAARRRRRGFREAASKFGRTDDATDVLACFVYFDGAGKIIGAIYDNTVGGIRAGKPKGVKATYPGTPPLRPSAVKRTVPIAYDAGF